MSRNTPFTIPACYADDARFEEVYRLGWNHGHGIACHNVPTLGERYRLQDGDRLTCDAETIRDIHADACYAAADNSRCFSPFEFIAKDINDEGDEAGALWDAFEAGTADAISADLADYNDEAYGIEAEDA